MMPRIRRGASAHSAALYLFVAFLVVCALTGGASRADAASQLLVRVASILFVATCLCSNWRAQQRDLRRVLFFLGACCLVVLLQLVPLPPQSWTALPGRAPYAEAALAAGLPQPWRPVSLTPDLTWNALLAFLPAIAAALGMIYQEDRDRASILPVLIAVALSSAVLGLAQLTAGPDSALRYYAVTSPDSAVGLFANRNHQAALLAAALPMLAVWASSAGKGKRARWLTAGGGAIFIMMMIPVSGSRAGLVLGAIGFVAGLVIVWPRLWPSVRKLDRRVRLLIWLGLALGSIGTVVAALTLSRAVAVQRLFAGDVGSEMRIQMLEPLWRMTREFMPLGSGFGSFDSVFRRFEPFDMLSFNYMNEAHNDLLQLAIEGGAPALLLLAVFVGWWAITAIRLWRFDISVSERRMRGRLGSIVTFMLLLASLPDYPLRTPLLSVVFVIGCCWMVSGSRAGSRGMSEGQA